MNHAPRFLALVDQAKAKIRQTDVHQIKKRLDLGEELILVDVREESEWAAGHLPGAVYMGRGIIERDIEAAIADLDTELVLYCGGGYRSALVADNLQQMGYSNVLSMDGGVRGWKEAGYPLEG